MKQIVYLNGDWLPLSEAKVNVEDRGFMFADGLYEVIRFYNGYPIAMDQHIQRLQNGLEVLHIGLGNDIDMAEITEELIKRNDTPDCIAYWQITRGVAKRNHVFPTGNVKPTVLAICYQASAFKDDIPAPTIKAITYPDERWLHCETKTTQLLPNVLARQAAEDLGCQEAILYRDGIITEATARSIFVVDQQGRLKTYPLDGRILDSITRQIVLEIARNEKMNVTEQPVTIEELKQAKEVLAVGTNTEVASVIELDGVTLNDGQAGEIGKKLFKRYRDYVKSCCKIK